MGWKESSIIQIYWRARKASWSRGSRNSGDRKSFRVSGLPGENRLPAGSFFLNFLLPEGSWGDDEVCIASKLIGYRGREGWEVVRRYSPDWESKGRSTSIRHNQDTVWIRFIEGNWRRRKEISLKHNMVILATLRKCSPRYWESHPRGDGSRKQLKKRE